MKSSVLFILFTFLYAAHTNTNDMQANLMLDAKAQLGEGSFWHSAENKLYWIDIEKKGTAHL